MTLEQQLDSLERVLDLIDRIKTGHEFLHNDDVLQKLQWTAKNIADEVWSTQLREAKT